MRWETRHFSLRDLFHVPTGWLFEDDFTKLCLYVSIAAECEIICFLGWNWCKRDWVTTIYLDHVHLSQTRVKKLYFQYTLEVQSPSFYRLFFFWITSSQQLLKKTRSSPSQWNHHFWAILRPGFPSPKTTAKVQTVATNRRFGCENNLPKKIIWGTKKRSIVVILVVYGCLVGILIMV